MLCKPYAEPESPRSATALPVTGWTNTALSTSKATATLAASLYVDEIAPITVCTPGVARSGHGPDDKQVTVSNDEGIPRRHRQRHQCGIKPIAIPGGVICSGQLASQFSDSGELQWSSWSGNEVAESAKIACLKPLGRFWKHFFSQAASR
jgi:hypothetical protein